MKQYVRYFRLNKRCPDVPYFIVFSVDLYCNDRNWNHNDNGETMNTSNILVFKYKSKEDTEKDIDIIFDYMKRNNIDMEDYRLQRITTTKESGFNDVVLYLTLGIRIRYRENIKDEIRTLLKVSS